jgi:universal stress protein A
MTPSISSIVVPTDFSPVAQRAIDYAATLARPLDASLHLLHVVEEPFAGGWEWYMPDAPALLERLKADSRTRLAEIADGLKKEGLAVTTEVRCAVPANGIVGAAADVGADLIVMSTHGRTGLPHLLLGSVAERVIRTAPCPVLAVREARAVDTSAAAEAAVSAA